MARIILRITLSIEAPHQRHCEERSDEAIQASDAALWIASRSLSSGARSRDPLARNDSLQFRVVDRLVAIERAGDRRQRVFKACRAIEQHDAIIFRDAGIGRAFVVSGLE